MERKITNILVGYDNSPSSSVALEKAAEIAKKTSARLNVVYVEIAGHFPDGESAEAHVAREIAPSGLSFQMYIRQGKPYAEIVKVSKEIGADLVLIGTHGHSGFMASWIGTTAFRVVSSCECPVITVPESAKGKSFTDILVPLDSTPETRQKLSYASLIARTCHSTCHILGVSSDKDQDTQNHLHVYSRQASEYLDKQQLKWTSEVMAGVKVADACMTKAEEKGCGMILMMKETESAGIFMGTVAQQLVNHASVPVMAIPNAHMEGAGGWGGY